MIGWAADGSGRKAGDALPKDRVGFETDRIPVALGCVPDRRPVEHKQPMAAGAGEGPIPSGAYLTAMGRPDCHGIRVEHDGPGRMPRVHPVNPLPRQIGRCGGRLSSPVGNSVSNCPIRPAHAACPATARPPTIHRIAGSTGSWPAMSVKPNASLSSRQAGHPASVVIPQPWNPSFRRRSKSSRRGPSTGSPAGFAICRAPKCAQDIGSHHRTNDQSHQSMESYGKCKLKYAGRSVSLGFFRSFCDNITSSAAIIQSIDSAGSSHARPRSCSGE